MKKFIEDFYKDMNTSDKIGITIFSPVLIIIAFFYFSIKQIKQLKIKHKWNLSNQKSIYIIYQNGYV